MKIQNVLKGMQWLILSFFIIAIPPYSLAEACSFGGHGSQGQGDHGWKLQDKFFYKAHYMLENKDAIGLSEDQVQSIKQQKTDVKKLLISRGAEIELLEVDIETQMHAYPVDETALTNLVEQKFRVKQSQALELAKAYAKLRNTLNEDQNNALKELWHKSPQ